MRVESLDCNIYDQWANQLQQLGKQGAKKTSEKTKTVTGAPDLLKLWNEQTDWTKTTQQKVSLKQMEPRATIANNRGGIWLCYTTKESGCLWEEMNS